MIVIAAPIKSEVLERYILTKYKSAKVLDMRAAINGPTLNLSKTYQYQCLNDIFDALSSTHLKLKKRIPTIKQDISIIAKKCNSYVIQSPYGWDDLC